MTSNNCKTHFSQEMRQGKYKELLPTCLRVSDPKINDIVLFVLKTTCYMDLSTQFCIMKQSKIVAV